jgi:hypothetical protein
MCNVIPHKYRYMFKDFMYKPDDGLAGLKHTLLRVYKNI